MEIDNPVLLAKCYLPELINTFKYIANNSSQEYLELYESYNCEGLFLIRSLDEETLYITEDAIETWLVTPYSNIEGTLSVITEQIIDETSFSEEAPNWEDILFLMEKAIDSNRADILTTLLHLVIDNLHKPTGENQ